MCVGGQPAQPLGAALDILYMIVKIIDLPAAGQLAPDGVADEAVVVLNDVGLHRLAALRRLLDDRHIADAAQRHAQGARDGSGRQCQHIDPGRRLLELFLMRHAEALLLIDDEEPKLFELDILLQQPMGADGDIDRAVADALDGLLDLKRR